MARQRGQLFFWLRLLLVIVVIGLGLLMSRPLSQLLLGGTTPSQVQWMRLALLGVVATSLSSATTALLRATRQFQRINVVVLTNAGLTAVIAVLLAFTGHLNLSSALLVLGIGTALVAFAIGRYLLPTPLDMHLPTRSFWRDEWLPFFRFSRWIGFSSIMVVLARQLDVILVNRWYAAATVGAYVLALNLAGKLELLNYSQYTVLTPAMAALPDATAARQFVRRSLRRNGLIALLLLPVWLLAGPFILFFYGQEYATAVPLFRMLFSWCCSILWCCR
ncbi:MAG: oligosaccharide flippase family protein [Anaerolineae bacterium]|nr:oligosaccharide flippase family protein [Anaerolineae bacterium]